MRTAERKTEKWVFGSIKESISKGCGPVHVLTLASSGTVIEMEKTRWYCNDINFILSMQLIDSITKVCYGWILLLDMIGDEVMGNPKNGTDVAPNYLDCRGRFVSFRG